MNVEQRISPATADLLARAEAVVDDLVAVDVTAVGDADALAVLRAMGRTIDRLDAARAVGATRAEDRGVLERDGAASVAAWLRATGRLSAREAANRARAGACATRMPVVGRAWAAGDVSAAHVAAIHGLRRDVDEADVDAVADELVTCARLHRVDDFRRLCGRWRDALAPDGLDERDARAYDNRWAAWSTTYRGTVDVRAVLDPVGGAAVIAALDALTSPDPADTPPDERRTRGQTRADALVDAARLLLATKVLPDTAGEPPGVVLRADAPTVRHATRPPSADHTAGADSCGVRRGEAPRIRRADLDGVGPVGDAIIRELLGDCWIAPIVSRSDSSVPDVGTTTRVWPGRLRRAITDRDRGCRHWACDRPPALCDIDHVRPVVPLAPGDAVGPTAYDNGILLCRYHHRHTKHPDRWWPALSPDGTVTWTHADGRTRTSHVAHRDDSGAAGARLGSAQWLLDRLASARGDPLVR